MYVRQLSEEVMYIKGAAKVYECDQDAYKGNHGASEIVAGDILVIVTEGCKGAPGMKELMLVLMPDRTWIG